MTALDQFDAVPRSRHLRRMAKSRVAHWEERIRVWLRAKSLPRRPLPRHRRGVRTRVVVTAGPVRLCREIGPDEFSSERGFCVWLWPEDRYKTASSTPLAGQRFVHGISAPMAVGGVRRLARYIAVREAAEALGSVR